MDDTICEWIVGRQFCPVYTKVIMIQLPNIMSYKNMKNVDKAYSGDLISYAIVYKI